MDFMEALFEETEECDEFHFQGIDVTLLDSNHTEVTYTFTYSNRWPMKTKVVFPGALIPEEKYRAAVFAVGMCVLPWYWMGHGCKTIIIDKSVGIQSPDVLPFWQFLYSNVLLEYIVCNPGKVESPVISFAKDCFQQGEGKTSPHKSCVPIPPSNAEVQVKKGCTNETNGVLVPLGGGKDSLVAWHLSQEAGRDADIFYVCEGKEEFDKNTRMHDIAREIGKDVLLVDHQFDYLDIVKRSKYNLEPVGHPWAALVLFDAVVVSLLCSHSEVHMGFEKSADFGNGIVVDGVEVNHQFDKSSEFLQAASAYITRFISAPLRVISPLDTLWDLEVAKIFCTSTRLKAFHSKFISCNEVVNVTEWCCKCEKCAFVCLILSAFLPPSEVRAVFHGRDLLSDVNMTKTFLSLVGGVGDGEKPFECVGTSSETQAAVEMTVGMLMKSAESDCYLTGDHGMCFPQGLVPVCDYLGISTSELPEYAGLPVDEQLTAVINKYING